MAYKIYGYDPPYRNKNMMPGMIMLWHGTVVNIPSGWHLCDGTAGTPDLRNKFVPGAGDEYAPGDNAANPTHTHPFTGDGHGHSISLGTGIQTGTGRMSFTVANNAVGTTDPTLAKPPYYALCYIMKL